MYMENMKLDTKGDMAMETLIRIVKTLDGHERHYRIEGTGTIRIEFVEGK